jgi:hypothetical protein
MKDQPSLPRRHRLIWRLLTLWVCLVTPLTWATEPIAIHPPQRDSGWSFNVAPYMWALRLDGGLTVDGLAGNVDLSDKEILNHLKAALMLEGGVRKDRVGVFGDFLVAKLEGDGAVGPLGRQNADVKLRMFKATFGVDYLLGPYPLASGTNAAQLTVAPYIAGRYFFLETDITSSLPAVRAEGSQSWLDPLIGVRTVWDLSRHWNVGVGGNVGGFGVGSDFAAEGLASVGYRFHLSKEITANVMAGYRALYQDYSHQDFVYDATLQGPFFGLDLDF